MDASTISFEAKKCLELFTELSTLLDLVPSTPTFQLPPGISHEIAKLAIEDSRAKFRAWGTNIAAFHESRLRTSLDSRLKEAPSISARTIQVLADLQEYLTSGGCSLISYNL